MDATGVETCMIPLRAVACVLAAAWGIPFAAGAGAQTAIADLGQLPGTPVGAWPANLDVSADGQVVVGSISDRAFRWNGTLQELQGGRVATAASADGSVVVGTLASPVHAFRWTAAGGLQDLGVPPGAIDSMALDVSADGNVIVGSATTPQGSLAWIWDEAVGMRSIGTLGPDYPNGATAVSADGMVVAGYSSRHAFRWTEEGGMVDISPDVPDTGSASAWAISADGTTIVGSYLPTKGVGMVPLQFRWTASSGFEDLASPDWGNISPGPALDTDSSGSHIVGFLFQSLGYASVWSQSTGTLKLAPYLESEGMDLTGLNLLEASAISDDGDVVVGVAYREVGQDQVPTAWRISGLTAVWPVFADGFEAH